MNKNNYIIGAIVIIIVIAIAVFGSRKTEAPTVPDQNANEQTNTTANNSSSQTKTTTSGTSKTTSTSKTSPIVIQPNVSISAIVTLTDSGFIPATIEIKNGQAVKFVNQSSTGMWVASNPYPYNNDYEAFNEGVTVARGGSYIFTFTRAGTWLYHNNNNPHVIGTVVVK